MDSIRRISALHGSRGKFDTKERTPIWVFVRKWTPAQRQRLSEEEVKVGKRTVGAGEVKLHKTVTTEQVNVPVELKHEDAVVERVPAHETEHTGKEPFQEESIEVLLTREEPVVEKETRVAGGVRVRKTQGGDQETIRENVGRETLMSMKAVKLADRQRLRENRAEEKLKLHTSASKSEFLT